MMQPHMAVAPNHSEAQRREGGVGGGGFAKKPHPVPVTVHPRKGGSQHGQNHGNITHC